MTILNFADYVMIIKFASTLFNIFVLFLGLYMLFCKCTHAFIIRSAVTVYYYGTESFVSSHDFMKCCYEQSFLTYSKCMFKQNGFLKYNVITIYMKVTFLKCAHNLRFVLTEIIFSVEIQYTTVKGMLL